MPKVGISVTIEPKTLERVDELAGNLGVTRSHLIDRALDQFVREAARTIRKEQMNARRTDR